MTIVVTGVAGFIGYHVARALLARGVRVLGIDNLNDYYDPALKQARLRQLEGTESFSFARLDVADHEALSAAVGKVAPVTAIVHLAAQAGVRYSLEKPFAYAHSNLVGQLSVLEVVRHLDPRPTLVYASSSSVYGRNAKTPFAVADRTDSPVSLYAATKKSGELIAESYAAMYGMPSIGLRFFTVYGPWGRPDMAYYSFTAAIVAGKAIPVFNQGKLERDFTYIDDVVAGVLAALDQRPDPGRPHRIYNLGNNRAEPIPRFIAVIEQALGRKAVIRYEPMQPGDVKVTAADIEDSRRDLGFEPSTPIDVGIPKFVAWYKDYHGIG